MSGNFIVLGLIIIIALLLGWLTWRALRLKKLWGKLAGGIGGGLLTLLAVAIAFMAARGMATLHPSSAPAAPDLTVAGTSEQIARGAYLVNLSCIGCHGAVDAEGMPTEQQPLTGGFNIAAAEGFGFMGSMVTENLTPGGKLASYSDGEIFRALRHSIDKNGTKLGFMDFLPYKELSDEDTAAIIAYLRSVPAAASSLATGDNINFVGAVLLGSGLFPPSEIGAASIKAPPQGITADYGKYVATFGECRGCHGADLTGTPESAMGPAIPNPRPLVGTLDQAQFMEMMRSGVKPDGIAFPETMPWQNAAKMTDDDLSALYAYLIAAVQ